MNTSKLKIWTAAALTLVWLAGCNDDSLFDGTDHYISSFELQQNEIVVKGLIANDSIIVTVAENISLEGATASVTISENATIEPDPSGITDWDSEQDFTVTGYDGSARKYHYKIIRTNVTGSGNIILATQDDVEKFAALGINELKGNLTIGQSTGADSISSLEALSSLKIITGKLLVNPTFAGTDLSGLRNLQQVGTLEFGAVAQLQGANFPALKSIMSGLTITGSKITSLGFPLLENIDGAVSLQRNDSITQVDFSSLKTVVNGLAIQGDWGNTAKLSGLSFPLLENVGGEIVFSQLPELTSVSMPVLKSAATVSVYNADKLKTIEIPQLKTLYKDLKIYSLQALTDCNISLLSTVGGEISIQNLPLIDNVEMLKSLVEVGGKCYLGLSAVNDLSPLNSFTRAKELSLAVGFRSLTEELPAFKYAERITVEGSSVAYGTIQKIDVSNIEGLTYLSLTNIANPVTITGPEIFDGTLYLYYSNFELKGFDQLATLYVYGFTASGETTGKETGIEKIKGDFTLSLSNLSGTFGMPDLKEIGGKFTLSGTVPVSFPELEEIGSLESQLKFSNGGILSFPKLKKVNGNFTVYIQAYQGYLDGLQVPLLETITGKLTFGGYGSYYTHQTLENLDCFSSLTSAGAITIQYLGALKDYSGLKNVINSVPFDQWKAVGNAYNPTYQDLVAGKWTE